MQIKVHDVKNQKKCIRAEIGMLKIGDQTRENLQAKPVQSTAKFFEHLQLFSGLIAILYRFMLVINSISSKGHNSTNIKSLKPH